MGRIINAKVIKEFIIESKRNNFCKGIACYLIKIVTG